MCGYLDRELGHRWEVANRSFSSMASVPPGASGSRCSTGSRPSTRCWPWTCPASGSSAPLPPVTRPTVGAMADALERALDAVGLERPHIAGNSMGGWLALELGRRGRAASAVAIIPPAGMWTEKERVYSRNVTASPARDRNADRALRGRRLVANLRLSAGRLCSASCISRPWRLDAGDAADTLRARSRAGPGWTGDPRGYDPIDMPREPRLDHMPRPDRLGHRATRCCCPRQADRFVREIPARSSFASLGSGTVPMVDDPERGRRFDPASSPRATRVRERRPRRRFS